MRALFDVGSASGSHTVYRSEGSIADAVRGAGGQVVIADARFADALADVDLPTVLVEAVEEEKTLARVTDVIQDLRRQGLTRDGRIVAMGGGIVQDVACFSASVYMRGVEWTYLPTTLLAMVDSCIGGKSSINVGEYKNIAGTFHPPSAIVVTPPLTETLPEEHLVAGFCEAAKITFAKGEAEFDRYLALYGALDGDRIERTGDIVEHSLRCKKWFVEVDEFDRAERQLLNFGHSFGHALESCTHYEVNHGVAVGVGVLSAARTSETFAQGVERLPVVEQLREHMSDLLAPLDGLEPALARVTREDFFRYFNSDKKHSPQNYRLILIDGEGRLFRKELPRGDGAESAIWSGFSRAREELFSGLR